MPCLEIRMPQTEDSVRKSLTEKLTLAFNKATGIPTDIFGICFKEYEVGKAASGGKIWDGRTGRPYLHFLLYCPRLKKAAKQAIVDSFTKVYCECIGNPDWKPVIHICEHPYDNIGVQGQLLSDSHEECAKSKFYYELPAE